MTTTTRIALLTLAVLAVPSAAAAQRKAPPTAGDVLQMFDGGEALSRAGNEARYLLRQVNGRGEAVPRTVAEIRTLVEGLVEIALAPCADDRCSGPDQARRALVSAAWRPGVYVDGYAVVRAGDGYLTADDVRGEPVQGAFDALVQIYETLAERALAGGGNDPFMEAAWRDLEPRVPDGRSTTREHWWRLYASLRDVFKTDASPGGRGWEYVLALFERSKPPCKEGDGLPGPPDCTVGPGSAWCAAGDILHQSEDRKTMEGVRPWPGPNPDLWKRRCGRLLRDGSSSPWNYYSDWRR
ncbi:MAG: hypothetical protein F4187_00515 [Gemmatimonadetes bacterium]|nr:hypothetical protein [Gemmatimonadota bacterium]MYI05758.1 hypothetical protein [Gemmatimonadota bacterium]